MSSEIYDIFAADDKVMDAKTPDHERKTLTSEIERITGKIENRLEAPKAEEKRKRPRV